MNIQRWIARRETNWRQLEQLLTQVEKRGLKSLNAGEIGILASLYRSVSADLARARTHNVGNTLIQDLQTLTARSYNQIYQGDRQKDTNAIKDFYIWGLPSVIQQTWGYIAVAFGIFLLGALVAWWFSWQDPMFMALVVPEGLIRMVRDRHELWMGSILGNEPLASSNIMINNMAVSFNAIAGGITGGVFSAYLLFFNGLLIGAIAVLVGQNGLAFPFWAFVFPHGSLELPAIFIAGGAGLLIARALLLPGQYRRVDAFRVYGSQAAQLVYGIIPMLLIAGAIEGFISPNPAIPDLLKYAIGMLLFVLLILYCQRQQQPD
ncbi:uncharacterized membrane protein [Synechococcus sp. PCC 7502]|uniref:stage II sporulation protein M n=1 Tax=Synechococcus sp. PCC 7502 TaxID=1173263 RepID=UPI00029FBB13|nr:stage II sporulation protein M [Synechococcus sp. PCC 7502]AFY74218.1 uncharacterized membrane protein [Synechococcus sp. PCC 7502]